MVELPKVRPGRVERLPDANPYPHQEDGHGWAVSYADVLMVLLSFFVVFFSLGKSETNNILNQILITEKHVNATKAADQYVVRSVAQDSKQNEIPVLDIVENLDVDFYVQKLAIGQSLILLLPDQAFASGSIVPSANSNRLLVSTLERLKKYKNDIDLTFIGYSDTQLVKAGKSMIRSNFDLSALRASTALNTAVDLGFPMSHLKAKGSSHFGRESRTLSIQVSVRGGS